MATIRVTEETLYKYRPFSPLPLTSPANAQSGDVSSVGSPCQSNQPGDENTVTTHAENRRSGHGNQTEKR